MKSLINLLVLVSSFLGAALPLYAGGGHCPTGTSFCWATLVGGSLLWIIVATILTFYVWNCVVVDLFKLKKVTFWQAFLVIAFLFVMCAPRHMRHHQGGYMGKSYKCHDCDKKGLRGKKAMPMGEEMEMMHE